MLITCWSAKGGSGTTVVAASLAVLLARSAPEGALFVDLTGDGAAVLGVPEPIGPGIGDWLAAADVDAAGLDRLAVPIDDSLALVPRGTFGPPVAADRIAELGGVPGGCGRRRRCTGRGRRGRRLPSPLWRLCRCSCCDRAISPCGAPWRHRFGRRVWCSFASRVGPSRVATSKRCSASLCAPRSMSIPPSLAPSMPVC